MTQLLLTISVSFAGFVRAISYKNADNFLVDIFVSDRNNLFRTIRFKRDLFC